MTHRKSFQSRLRAVAVCGAASLFLGLAVCAQNSLDAGSGLTPEQERELDYADRLLEARMPNYSTLVLDKLNLPPEIMNIRKVQGFCALGKFAEAEAIVAAHPGDTQGALTLKLALADGYYAHGKYDKAQALYDSFFKKFPNGPEGALKPFYMASAYKYAQMMLLTGNRKVAADAYRMAIKAKPERHIARQLQSELCEVLIQLAEDASGAERDALLKETKKIVDEILWVQDVWFGRGVVMLAHMEMMQGNVDKALSLVEDYTSILREIDANLLATSTPEEDLTKLSPMAQCRYLIGKIMQEEAERIIKEGGDRQKALELLIGKGGKTSGAVQHFLNVFIRYPNTAWAPDAGNRFRKVEEMLKTVFDKEIKTKITPEQWAAVEAAQFREARTLFNQQRFPEAVVLYEQVLGLFPDRETAVQALGELAACYIETGDIVLADTVVRHTAERFNKHATLMAQAGDQVVRIAFKYGEQDKPEKLREIYGVFFEYFKNHPRTVLELYRFADEAFRNNELDLALEYYQRIAADHEGKPAYMDALNRITSIYEKQGKVQEQIKALDVLVKKLVESGEKTHLQISAMYRFAVALKGLGPKFADRSVQKFNELEALLKDEAARSAYQKNPDEAKANLQVLQGAMLFGAISDATRKDVPEAVQAAFEKKAGGKKVPPEWILKNYYKVNAIKKLGELVTLFPDSPFAPSALSQVGTLYTVIGKADEARKALQQLQKDYPESNEAKNAVFMIGLNLLEMGMRTEAVAYFKQMFSGGGEYTQSQLLTASRTLFDAGEYAIAIEGYDRIIQSENEQTLLEAARVGKGLALVRLERFADAVTLLEKVLEDYPKSGYTVDICRAASAAYAAVASVTADEPQRFDLFNKAVTVMVRARRLVKDEGTRTELDVGVARIFERKSAAERQFGTAEKADAYRDEAVAAYQAVIMFRAPGDAAVDPHLQDAYASCLPLMLDMKRWDDVVQDAQDYVNAFPKGKHILAVRQALNRARVSGGAAQTAETTGETPAADDEPLL